MIEQISTRQLQSFAGLDRLTTDTLRELLPNFTLEFFNAGEFLVKPGEHPKDTLYLLEGHIQQIEQGQTAQEIDAHSDASKYPIAEPSNLLAPMIIAATPVTIVHIPTNLLKRLILEKSMSVEVDESGIFDDELQNTIFTQFFIDYQQDKIALPSLPDIALKVSRAIQEPNMSLHTIAKIISIDPAIASRIIQVANSPLFRGSSSISCCHEAITRLGLKMTQQLVTSFTMKQLFTCKQPTLIYKMQRIWQHAKAVSAMSFVLAKFSKRLKPDIAMLAGLIHEIGAVAILQHAEKYADLIENSQHLNATMLSLQSTIGTMTLQSWNFDEQLITVASEANHWTRKHHHKADYADLVQVAKLHCYIGHKNQGDYPIMADVPAFQRLTKGKLTPKKSLAIIQQARSQIQALEALF